MKKLMIAMAFAGLTTAVSAQTSTIEPTSKYSVATNSFGSNWFIQFGLDMSLQNPYYSDFSKVFPKGTSTGINIAAGKWFTPGLGLRAKLNWEEGLFKSGCHNEWTPGNAYSDGNGYAFLAGDVLFNLSNLIYGYNENRVWNLSVFPRAGVVRLFAHSQYIPLLGVGVNSEWKLSRHWGVYAEASYNMSTDNFAPYQTTMSYNDHARCNAFLNLEAGVQYSLGKGTFSKAVSVDAYNALAASSEEALAKLRADLDAEKAANAELRNKLANAPKTKVIDNVISNAATNVFFDINSTVIKSPKDILNLEAVANAAKKSGGTILVKGMADSATGTTGINQTLSEGRANAVVEKLVEFGVSRDKIITNALGGVNDVSPIELNRRALVEIK